MTVNSGEIYIANKLAELATRYGVSPTVADFSIHFHDDEKSQECFYHLGSQGDVDNPKHGQSIKQMSKLLGLNEFGERKFGNLEEVEKVVDQALSDAPTPPRVRARR